MQIGTVLAQARGRAGLDLREVEERTKIRIKYLQALEDEEWSELPSGSYAKGFLRTYGELLGLDGEALVDEYRRQLEPETALRGYPLADGSRQRPGGIEAGMQGSHLGPALAITALVAAAVAILIVLSGDDQGDEQRKRPGAERGTARGQVDERPRRASTGEPVALTLVLREQVEVCLIGGGGGALIDGQLLAPGTRERFVRKRFELGFPSGFDPDQLRVAIAGEPRRLPAVEGPAAFEISSPGRLRPAEPRAAEDCP